MKIKKRILSKMAGAAVASGAVVLAAGVPGAIPVAANTAYISRDAAKTAALNHAKVDASRITNYEIEFDKEKYGAYYEIEFDANGYEYDYKINATNATVIESEKKAIKTKPYTPTQTTTSKPVSTTASVTYIGNEKAKMAALNHAKLNASRITNYMIEIERENGKVYYEIGFKSGGYEYDYHIDAVTGKVLKFEKEPDKKTGTLVSNIRFSDVTDKNVYYYSSVYWAAQKGIATGTNGRFFPAAVCNREQAITFLWRMAGQPEPKSMVSKFSDVKNTKSYSYKAILWGREKGIITGENGKFNPAGSCSREQIITMIWRLAGKPEPRNKYNRFKDVKDSKSYAYKAITWAQEKGIAAGSNGDFSPKAACKRGEIVTFMYRYRSHI